MAFWLVKSEPSVYSVADFKRDKVTHWHGVRNFQARNLLKEMAPGDEVLFYHSNEAPVGVAGLGRVKKRAYPDPSQFDRSSEYFDPRARADSPRWFCPDIEFVKAFDAVVTLDRLRSERSLAEMVLLKRGTRLSVQPVTSKEFKTIVQLAEAVSVQDGGKRKKL